MDSIPVLPQLSNPSTSHETKPSLPQPLKKFYLGEPLVLGITQILTGIIGIIFAIVMDATDTDYEIYVILKASYWTGILYIISGSLSVAAARNPKMSLVKGMLGMNVVGAVTAGVGIILLCMSLIFDRRYYYFGCHDFESEADKKQCADKMIYRNTRYGILAVLLVFAILECCIAISSAAFGCKTVCRNTYAETIVVVYQNMAPSSADNQTDVSKDPKTF
ncbi:membrane-spanning 4-domains subfamily A member 4A [Anolis carolinensis]|uniref:membrane-spanning 4-domains subfamily A member 4A n=1 Tax=Anolis carolinensis TaxID=28377 RepID=UPI002F2B62DB